MSSSGRGVGVAQAAENAKVLILRLATKKELVRCTEITWATRAKVKEVCGGV